MRGWHRIIRGWYKYTNNSGDILALVERTGAGWVVTVLPLGRSAHARVLSDPVPTYREAKKRAQRVYMVMSRRVLTQEREDLKRLGFL